MRIAIGSDHGGYDLKKTLVGLLKDRDVEVVDLGCHSRESVDYPDFADLVCKSIVAGEADFGILICGTGIGMSLAANRSREIRAALCHDEYTARMTRAHNDANLLCLGARVLGEGVVEGILDVWLKTEFEGDRHLRRIRKFSP